MPNSFSGDRVQLDLSREDFDRLMLTLGFFAGVAPRDGDRFRAYRTSLLANVLNEGNPHWTPFELPLPPGTNVLDATSDPLHGVPRE